MLRQGKIVTCLAFGSAFIFAGLSLSFPVSATPVVDPSSSATATVHVSEACSLTSSVITPHTDNMGNGTSTESLGSTKFTVKCNDASGFALYAIGYSGDEYGATSMLGDNELSIPTGTDASAGNTTSHWSMKISKGTTSYLPNSLTIENSFGSQHLIPSTYTKIASFPSSTDGINGTGSSILATYGVRISGTQAAGTYIGKVKFTLVHPSTAGKPEIPFDPLNQSDCPAGYVCYAPNASDIEGSMSSLGSITSSPTAGKISVGNNATTIDLIAPNYKREGYGFAGWSKDFTATNASTIYGPNETLTVPSTTLATKGMILYPVWVASAGNLQGWSGCNSLDQATYDSTNHKMVATLSSVTALTDTRDGNVYAVARLADGKCWMIENLRLADTHNDNGNIVTTAISTSNTHNPLNTDGTVNLKIDYANNTVANHLASTSDSWCTSTSADCFDQTMLNTNNTNIGGKNASNTDLIPGYNTNTVTAQWYSYSNYYNWYSATAGNGTYSKSSGDVDGDFCPAGWHLPYGNNIGTGNTAGGFNYLNTLMANNTSTQGSKDFRSFPNNFIYSGRFNSLSANSRGSGGFYWSSSARNSYYAYNLYLYSSGVYPGTNYNNKNYGFSVRCISQ